MFDLSHKRCIITGAAGGIGRALSQGLLEAGASVTLVDLDGEALAETADQLGTDEAARSRIATIAIDLTDGNAVDRILDHASDAFGPPNCLVNNAGINRRQLLVDVDRDAYDKIMDVNLRVPGALATELHRRLNGAEPGSIVNIGSINVKVGLQGVGIYGQAKAGLAQLTRVMAVEWAESDMRANCICPGFIETPLSAPVLNNPATRGWIVDRLPNKRLGTPSDLVGPCVFLLSDASAYVTGQCLYVDGGFSAGSPFNEPLPS